MLYKLTEWYSDGSHWNCGCLDALGKGSNTWYYPARILKISPAEFIELVITKFKPDHTYFNKEKCLFFFSWSDQSKMRLYKNYINAEARKVNFQI